MARILLDDVNHSGGSSQLLPGTVANDNTGDQAFTGSRKLKQNLADLNSMTAELYANAVTLSLTPNSSAAAAANTAILNSAFSAGGLINCAQTGLFYVNTTCWYNSFTTFIAGANTEFRLAPGSNCAMLAPAYLQTVLNGGATWTNGTSVTLTQGTGCAVTVGWTAHGFKAGDFAWISGAASLTVNCPYNGVFRISSVTDANSFVIFTTKFPTAAATGTLIGMPATTGFRQIGGIWNYDSPNQTPSSGYNQIAVLYTGVANLKVESVTIKNASKYCYSLQAFNDVEIDCIEVSNAATSDGGKVYGPGTSLNVDGQTGITHDDFFSLQARESTAFLAYAFSAWGDLYDMKIRNLTPTASVPGGFCVPLHIYGSDNESMDLIEVEGVNGVASGQGVSIGRGVSMSVGLIGRVKLRNIQPVTQATLTAAMGIGGCTIQHLTIDDITYNPGVTGSAANQFWLAFSGNAVINECVISRFKSDGYPLATQTSSLINLNGAAIKKLTLRDWAIANGAAAGMNVLQFGSAANLIGEIVVENCYCDNTVGTWANFATAQTSGTVGITFKNNSLSLTNSIAFQVNQPVKVRYVCGNNIAATNIVRSSQANTIEVRSDGTNTFAGTILNLSSFTGTCTVYGNDLAIDVGLAPTVATTVGQFCKHTSGVAGRNNANQQGLAVATGSNWYSVGTGPSGANQLIV